MAIASSQDLASSWKFPAATVQTVVAILLVFVYVATHFFYNAYLGPLRSIPGPKAWASSRIIWDIYNIRGELVPKIQDLHKRYGNVVRVGPHEVSFLATSIRPWKTIYAHQPQEMMKDLSGHGLLPAANGVPGLPIAPYESHRRMRRAIAPAFSDRALRDQEGYINLYVSKLTNLLRETIPKGACDLSQVFNWTTFDIIGDLGFGEPFGSLDKSTTHPWIDMIFTTNTKNPFFQLMVYYNLIGFMTRLIPASVRKNQELFFKYSNEKVEARLARNDDRSDFMSYISRGEDTTDSITRAELHSSASVLIIAGSETSASLLSGLTYNALSNPEIYYKIVDEVRSSFKRKEDISIASASKLHYLSLVIQEAFRMYPPIPAALPRVVPGKGEMIEGHWVPGGTVVGIHHFATNHSERNFANPDKFVPERWEQPNERPAAYENDHREAHQPFSYGARNCVGQNLAHAEIRLILCHVLWNFDLELQPESKDWSHQRAYMVWHRQPLLVKIKQRST
ncbi:MAG: hypothetical protein M1828_005121 [Chrysothrix sp. TS-e1954]|nr:MAG: hypothetical protein M1828_005121 [Chrysothrix sp. TS-e1954]